MSRARERPPPQDPAEKGAPAMDRGAEAEEERKKHGDFTAPRFPVPLLNEVAKSEAKRFKAMKPEAKVRYLRFYSDLWLRMAGGRDERPG